MTEIDYPDQPLLIKNLKNILAPSFSLGRELIINRLLASGDMQFIFAEFRSIQQRERSKDMFVLLAAFLWLDIILFVTATVRDHRHYDVAGRKVDFEDLRTPAVSVQRGPGANQVPIALLKTEDMGVLREVPPAGIFFLFEHDRITVDGQVFYLGILRHGMGREKSQHFCFPKT